MTIQYINYNGKSLNGDLLCKTNKLSSPESFDDFDINIIDLSSEYIWENYQSNAYSINYINDIKNIAKMINKTISKTLVILPQNLDFKFNYGLVVYPSKKDFTESIELKNHLILINKIIETLLNLSLDSQWLIYDKTKTNINGNEINSDFIFQNIHSAEIITLSKSGTSATTIRYSHNYITTLNLNSNYNLIIAFLEKLGWISFNQSTPDWLVNEHFFNDEDLQIKKEKLLKDQLEISTKILEINTELELNNFYKSILYKTGDELVDVVNVMLDEMIGYDYKNFVDKKEEDFLIEKENFAFIGEIKGISSNIKRSNVSQTTTHRDYYLEKEGNESKNAYAIAIINRQREVPVEERENVHDDVIHVAEINNVLIITSETFLKLYENFKFGKISTENIINLFKTKSGLLSEKDFSATN